MDIVVIGAGPAGLSAALRAAELGGRTVLVTRGEPTTLAPTGISTSMRSLYAVSLARRESFTTEACRGQVWRGSEGSSVTILDFFGRPEISRWRRQGFISVCKQ
jgi:succinate dehydrogenase/fumarate reductase flavoprotein subunit